MENNGEEGATLELKAFEVGQDSGHDLTWPHVLIRKGGTEAEAVIMEVFPCPGSLSLFLYSPLSSLLYS